jgi:hypothetical protein
VPYGTWVNDLPVGFFMLVHLIGFGIGAYCAWRAFEGSRALLGWGFTLYALAEISYMTYHLDWTIFLFAHTVSEVFDLAAFVLIFIGALGTLTAPASRRGREATHA